ncbi:MAG: hypothetical protein SGJ20_06100 [Planctomycetota bacterium]|nr:hypothetical protein [Planctomycetota bacterium]
MPVSALTPFSRLNRRQSLAVLIGVVVSALLLIAITLSPLRSGFADVPLRNGGDVALYQAEIQRIQSGEGYYTAAATELAARGYPTASPFNWRTPLPIWLVGVLPIAWLAHAVLIVCVVATLYLAMRLQAQGSSPATTLLLLFLLVGGLLPALLDPVYIMPEVWAGVLISLSILLRGSDNRGAAVLAGVAALFVREFAAPFCVLGVILAIQQRDWRSVRYWLLGLAAYAIFYLWHVQQVWPLIQPDARQHEGSWWQFGGAAFVLSLVQVNGYLLLLPQWISAIYLVLAMVGFAAAKSDWTLHAAWTAVVYVILFGMLGHNFNQYWGALIAPLLCLGVAQAPATIRDLRRNCRTPAVQAASAGST